MELCAFQSTEKIFSPYICEPPYWWHSTCQRWHYVESYKQRKSKPNWKQN